MAGNYNSNGNKTQQKKEETSAGGFQSESAGGRNTSDASEWQTGDNDTGDLHADYEKTTGETETGEDER
eukprot:12881102-Prorocentrum_lima.AAC.1